MKRLVLLILASSLVGLLCACAPQDPSADLTLPPVTDPVGESNGPTEPVSDPLPDYGVAPDYIPAKTGEETEVVMSFVGDCQPGSDFGTHSVGSYNWYADNNPPSYFLSGVQSVFATDDLTVIDCESVLTDSQLAPVEKAETPAYWHYGPAANAKAFSEGSVEIASTANNHTGDYGTLGFADTVAALEAVGVIPGIDMEPIYYETKGLTVGVLCCNCWSSYHASRVKETLSEMNEKSDIQVVFPHGGSMNTYIPDAWRVDEFRSFIDAGAEVVAAGHPHLLQPLESYKGGVIVYSLGNFSYGGSTLPENATVILSVRARFEDGVYQDLSYELIPCYLYTTPRNNYMPELIPPTHPAYNRILEFMYGLRDAPVEQ